MYGHSGPRRLGTLRRLLAIFCCTAFRRGGWWRRLLARVVRSAPLKGRSHRRFAIGACAFLWQTECLFFEAGRSGAPPTDQQEQDKTKPSQGSQQQRQPGSNQILALAGRGSCGLRLRPTGRALRGELRLKFLDLALGDDEVRLQSRREVFLDRGSAKTVPPRLRDGLLQQVLGNGRGWGGSNARVERQIGCQSEPWHGKRGHGGIFDCPREARPRIDSELIARTFHRGRFGRRRLR